MLLIAVLIITEIKGAFILSSLAFLQKQICTPRELILQASIFTRISAVKGTFLVYLLIEFWGNEIKKEIPGEDLSSKI